MHWIVISLFAIYVGVVIWATLDAYDQTDLGCLWLLLFITTPVLSVIAYLILRAYAFRRREPAAALDPREYQGPLKHFGSEIEKARFIEARRRPAGRARSTNRSKAVHRPAATATSPTRGPKR